jgi:hypothetical protein
MDVDMDMEAEAEADVRVRVNEYGCGRWEEGDWVRRRVQAEWRELIDGLS